MPIKIYNDESTEYAHQTSWIKYLWKEMIDDLQSAVSHFNNMCKDCHSLLTTPLLAVDHHAKEGK